MDVSILRHALRDLSRTRMRDRAFAIGLLVTLGCCAVPVGAAAPAFDLHASINRTPTVQTGTGFELHAQWIPMQKSASSGGYEISAHVVGAPSTCAGDLILRDGFDGL